MTIIIFITSFIIAFAYSRFERENNKYYRKWYNVWNSKKRKKTEENSIEGFFFQRSWKRILSNGFLALGLISLVLWIVNFFMLGFGLALTIDSFGLWVTCYLGILAGVGLTNLPGFMRDLKEGKAKELMDTAKDGAIAVIGNTTEGLKEVVNQTKDVFDDTFEGKDAEQVIKEETNKEIETVSNKKDEKKLDQKDLKETEPTLKLKELDDIQEEKVEPEKKLSAREKIRNKLNQ